MDVAKTLSILLPSLCSDLRSLFSGIPRGKRVHTTTVAPLFSWWWKKEGGGKPHK